MIVYLNGDQNTIADNTSAMQLIHELGLTDKRIAMEVNCHIVPRSQFESFVFSNNDKIELIHAIGGG